MWDIPDCFPVEGILSDGTGDDPAAVARAHDGATGLNTLDTEYPQGGKVSLAEALDPADAKRDGGAGWVADSTQDGSSASSAANNSAPGSAGSAKTGADLGDGGDDASAAGGASSASTAAAAGALW